MGLDLVELVMDVEYTFGIKVSDAKASECKTVGDLYDIVVEQLEVKSFRAAPTCHSRRAFYALRHGLMTALQVPRQAIRRRSRLGQWLPWRQRRRLWRQVGEATGVQLPALVRPAFVVLPIASMCVMLTVIGAVGLCMGLSWPVVMLLVMGGPVIGFSAYCLTKPLAVEFRYGSATIEGTVDAIVASNFSALSPPDMLYWPDTVWCSLRTVVAESLGVREAEIYRHTRWAEDLNAG